MRKISQLAALAFRGERNFAMGNTTVTVSRGSQKQKVVEMYLFGNLIARRDFSLHGITMVSVTLADWPTPTTRERLNGLLEMLGAPVQFYQSKKNQWLGAETIGDDDWNTVGTRC